MGMPAPLYYTADMVRDLIDENRPWPRYELVYGDLLVSPAPRPLHQLIVGHLAVGHEQIFTSLATGQSVLRG